MNHFTTILSTLLPVLWLLSPAVPQTTRTQNSNAQESATQVGESHENTHFDCLPPELSSTDIVAFRKKQESNEETATVKDALIELGAQCRAGTLVDSQRKTNKVL